MATSSLQQAERLAAALDRLPFRVRLNILIRIGVSAEEVMGVDRCLNHPLWRPLQPFESLSFEGDVLWCRQCWKWVRA
jgi:hypothetical protein